MAQTQSTMDFFAHQDAARKKTVLLTIYFILALAFIIAGVYLAVFFAWSRYVESRIGFWQPMLLLWTTVGVLTIVTAGSIYKIIFLSKGGERVAAMLGAVPVDPNTPDPDQRRLFNVVEEMAIASGIPVPQVFLLQKEEGINAFAAGFTPFNAVVGVTRGTISRLTRDELQGVIAHEFSHILNGDMGLNIRLLGIINGILIIGTIGWYIVRGTSSGRSSSSSKKGGGAGPIIIMGLIILVVGYIGVFFGKLIKSAVSRQREFLADASAVQFARNPSGIAGALKKIAGFKTGSRIYNAHAEEASHFFFGNGLAKPLLTLLATHPPLEERIRRIDTSFDPEYEKIPEEALVSAQEPLGARVSSFAQAHGTSGKAPGVLVHPDRLDSMVGAPRPEHLAYAAGLISDLPPLLAEAAHEPFGARALIYCLLLNKEEQTRKIQLERLNEHADSAVMRQTRMLIPVIDTIGQGYRLPLADMAIPALKILSPNQYNSFRANVKHLIEADRKISLFEYTLHCMVVRHLDPLFLKTERPRIMYRTLDSLQVECFTLLSALAWHAGDADTVASESFKQGMAELHFQQIPLILPRGKCGLKVLAGSLKKLASASPQIKKRILRACIVCISADGWVTLDEAELLRAIADSLECPIPPILPGSDTGNFRTRTP